MNRFAWIVLFQMTTGLVFGNPTEDVANAKDHPQVSRFPGYFIDSYDQQDYGVHEFPIQNGVRKVEGKYWEFEYVVGEGNKKAGPLQIARNYFNAISARGGEKLYEEVDTHSGVTTLRYTNQGASLWIHLDLANDGDFYRMYVIEEAGLQQQVDFTAETLSRSIEENGSVNISDILFDTGAATIKPESAKVLSVVAAAMQLTSGTYTIIGHTDNAGMPEANLKLSLARAESVKSYLVNTFKIMPTRLLAAGLGDCKPIASNDNEDGRRLNRRVEIVKPRR